MNRGGGDVMPVKSERERVRIFHGGKVERRRGGY